MHPAIDDANYNMRQFTSMAEALQAQILEELLLDTDCSGVVGLSEADTSDSGWAAFGLIECPRKRRFRIDIHTPPLTLEGRGRSQGSMTPLRTDHRTIPGEGRSASFGWSKATERIFANCQKRIDGSSFHIPQSRTAVSNLFSKEQLFAYEFLPSNSSLIVDQPRDDETGCERLHMDSPN